MSLADKFNATGFSHWLNRKPGRIFRLSAGIFFVIIGVVFYDNPWSVAALLWSIFPLSAGALDICYISGALGGPFTGKSIRIYQSNIQVQKAQ